MTDLIERIERYAIRYFDGEGEQCRWPRLSKVARGLKVRQVTIQDALDANDCAIELTGFNFDGPMGDKFVEAYEHQPTPNEGAAS